MLWYVGVSGVYWGWQGLSVIRDQKGIGVPGALGAPRGCRAIMGVRGILGLTGTLGSQGTEGV